jgi:hypothetical protein
MMSPELQGDAVLDDRVVRMRDVAEGAGVDQHRLALQRLDEVGADRVAHDDGHRSRGLEILRGDRLPVPVLRNDDAAEPRAEVLEIRREREDRHHLGGRRDHEASLARDAVHLSAEADDAVAELPVVDVERPRPRDRRGVDVERVPVVDRRVERSGEQVVRRRDRVEVAVEVEVDLLHRNDLRVAAAGSAALDAEHRPMEARAGRASRVVRSSQGPA